MRPPRGFKKKGQGLACLMLHVRSLMLGVGLGAVGKASRGCKKEPALQKRHGEGCSKTGGGVRGSLEPLRLLQVDSVQARAGCCWQQLLLLHKLRP